MSFRERAKAVFQLRFFLNAAAIALAVGLAAPLLDMLLRSTSLEPAYESLGTLLQGLGLLLAGYLCWYGILLVAAVIPLALLTSIPATALAGVAALFATIPAYQTFEGTSPRVWLATTALSVLILLMATRASRRPASASGNGVGLLAAVAGAVLLEAFAFHWLTRFPLRVWARSEPTTAIAIYGIVVLATSLFVVRAASKRIVGIAFALGLLTVAWTPAKKLYAARYLTAPIAMADASSATKVPHEVLIVVDTLRADALTYRNPDARPTPNIDRLAADSVVFENAVSPAPWTFPAMNSMMTGVAPYVDREEFTYPTAPLRTMADYLLDAGYRTGLVSGNELLDRPANVVNGILEADVYAALATGSYRTSLVLWDADPTIEAEANTRAVTNRTVDWIRDAAAAPFFLWVQFFDPHDPYAPSKGRLAEATAEPVLTAPYGAERIPEKDRPAYTDYYRAEVQSVDEHVGRIVAELQQQGLYEDSLIILTSDHGEEFWEHGGTVHAHSLYQELLHVPLIIKPPHGGGGRRVEAFAPTLALLPTVLELAGIQCQPEPGWTPSLMPLIEGETTEYPTPIISTGTRTGGFQRSVVIDGMKYISYLDSGQELVFDLRADPGEQNDIVAERPDVVELARQALARHEDFSAGIRTEYGLDLTADETTPEMLDKLRSLGYIQ